MTSRPAGAKPRFGVLRPERSHPAIAMAEARVLFTELGRRLGPVELDLRIDGEPLADWQPIANASWPADIDTSIDPDLLWGPDLPPLTALFGRTVDPTAASVRRRMLRHLGVIPDGPFDLDADLFDRLDALPIRPTDLWLIAGEARSVIHPDPALCAFVAPSDGTEHAQLDQAFDRAVDGLVDTGHNDHVIARLSAQVDALGNELETVRSELLRTQRESTDRLDELTALNSSLSERLERAELGRAIDDRRDS
jgi:hypothetical protein